MESLFFQKYKENVKSRAHTFSKSAPEGKLVRHDGRTVFRKVRPWQFFCAICQMAQPKCIPGNLTYLVAYVCCSQKHKR